MARFIVVALTDNSAKLSVLLLSFLFFFFFFSPFFNHKCLCQMVLSIPIFFIWVKNVRGCNWFCTETLQCWAQRSWSWLFRCTGWRWWSTCSLRHCHRSWGSPERWTSLIWLWTFLYTRPWLKALGLNKCSKSSKLKLIRRGAGISHWLLCPQFKEK